MRRYMIVLLMSAVWMNMLCGAAEKSPTELTPKEKAKAAASMMSLDEKLSQLSWYAPAIDRMRI